MKNGKQRDEISSPNERKKKRRTAQTHSSRRIQIEIGGN